MPESDKQLVRQARKNKTLPRNNPRENNSCVFFAPHVHIFTCGTSIALGNEVFERKTKHGIRKETIKFTVDFAVIGSGGIARTAPEHEIAELVKDISVASYAASGII